MLNIFSIFKKTESASRVRSIAISESHDFHEKTSDEDKAKAQESVDAAIIHATCCTLD